ncbi:MAG: YdeI/OmpD-associated family protein [Bacteroidota bacterium]
MSKKRAFTAEILQAADKYKNGAYIKIPFDVEAEYGKKRVKIKATFDGEPYRGLLVRMGQPEHILIIKKDIRTKIDKNFGDTITVTLEEDTEPRVVTVPEDFAAAMNAAPEVVAFFQKLSYTHQKEYVQWIEGAKREETRNRRINKALEMMKSGKKSR